MKYGPPQVPSDDHVQMLTAVASHTEAILPQGAAYISLLILPGGETGLQARIVSNLSEDLIARHLKEFLGQLETNRVGRGIAAVVKTH